MGAVFGEVVEEARSVQGSVCLLSSILGGGGKWCEGWRKVSCFVCYSALWFDGSKLGHLLHPLRSALCRVH